MAKRQSAGHGVSVLGEAEIPIAITKHDVAAAADTTIQALIALGEEGGAFARTATIAVVCCNGGLNRTLIVGSNWIVA
ncbi:MAG TPA: hypothetical protein PK450_00655 [Paracoccaceae bacterium]|nr:hypothetical protein [Paracoccaceae bacterium]